MTRTITAVSNPVYSNSENTTIDCLVTFSDIGQHPYTAAENDPVPYGVALWQSLIALEYGAIGAYVAPIPSPAKLGYNAIAAGISLTSTGTPSLNGIYPCDPATQAKVNGLITCIIINGTFPNGEITQNWFDISGNSHTFPNVTAFKNFATAFVNFITPIDEYIASEGELGSIPINAITIP